MLETNVFMVAGRGYMSKLKLLELNWKKDNLYFSICKHKCSENSTQT